MLRGIRVLDRTTGIAGPYCSKLLADAGADVIKEEPPTGDQLRNWRSGALFEYLNTSKRSIFNDRADLVRRADVLITEQPVDTEELWSTHPALVVVSITPFGCSGPWVDRASTEFTLQAACGSVGQRGLPDQPPLAAGGRIGEWATGAYAAVGTIAALKEARRCGQGEHVDVAMLDCMAVTMVTYPSVFASFSGVPPQSGTGRTIEVPSIEPTKDGFFVVTTNSAQQFQDFLVMIERADLLADTELPQSPVRFRRRDEFLSAVHGFTLRHTTAEMLEAASLYRIPAGPLLDGSSIPDFAQFKERGIFQESPSGRFLQPRVPYRISGTQSRPFEPAPEMGQHQANIHWHSPATSGKADGAVQQATDNVWRLPLHGIRVVDCTAWWAGPSATNVLTALGADVIKVESVTRPDNMRFASTRRPPADHWWEWGPIFHAVNVGKRDVTIDLSTPDGIAIFERLIETADVMVENFTPRVMEQFGLTWNRLHELNPNLVMARMPAFGLDGPWKDRTGFAQTMESLTGMAWVTGFADGPPVLVRGACDPLGGMHAVFAIILALMERDDAGGGRLVEAAMVEAVLNAAAEQVVEYGATGTVLGRDGNRGLVAAPQGVYPAAGEDQWIAIAVTTTAQWHAMVSALDHPAWGIDEQLRHAEGRQQHHDEIDRWISDWTSTRGPHHAVDILLAAGIPAAVVIPPRDVAGNPQLRHRRLFETENHPITGAHEIPMLPFRFSRIDRWLQSPAPTLGQHNDEVLRELGYSAEFIVTLSEKGILGTTPQGQ